MSTHPSTPQPQPGSAALVASSSHVRLVLTGELDLLMKPRLLDLVREAVLHDLPVVVDTRQVTFMDSSVIATLSRLVQAAKRPLTFIDPAPVVRFLLEVTGIGALVDIVDEKDAATTTGTPEDPRHSELESAGSRHDPETR